MKRPRTVRDVVRRGPSRLVAGKTSRDVLGGTASELLHWRINPQWEWYYRVLLRLRERRLQDRAARLAEAAQSLESHSLDPADSAIDELDRNMVLAELSTGSDAREEIEAAIGRISKGAHGICEATGRPIPAARLKAVPWTRFARKDASADQEERRHLATAPRTAQFGSQAFALTRPQPNGGVYVTKIHH